MFKKNRLVLSLWVFILSIILLLVGCAGSLDKGPWTQGQRLYRAKCRSCHKLINPKKHSDEEWKVFVEKYSEKSNLTESERRQILQYLLENN